MLSHQNTYPVHHRLELAVRTGKLAALAGLARHPKLYGTFIRAAERLGFDPRQALRTASKSFGDVTRLDGLRARPSPATLRLLAHRLNLATSHADAKQALA
jgi:hypothetical protein